MKTKYIPYLIIVIVLLSFTNKWEHSNELFKIERSRDADEIEYSLNIDSEGMIVSSNPIEVHWVKNTKNGQFEPLTWIQKKYAYGIKYLNNTNNKSEFCFVSYPKRTFTLKQTDSGYKVFTTSDNQEVEVNRIFIQFDGGTFWIPIISKVELHGTLVSNHTPKVEVINP